MATQGGPTIDRRTLTRTRLAVHCPGGVLAVAFLELQKLAREVVSLLLAKLNLACNVRQNVLQSPARRPSMGT